MRRVMRTGSLGLIVKAISLGVSPGFAQNGEQVKPVFEQSRTPKEKAWLPSS
jgi:hypothetical protein